MQHLHEFADFVRGPLWPGAFRRWLALFAEPWIIAVLVVALVADLAVAALLPKLIQPYHAFAISPFFMVVQQVFPLALTLVLWDVVGRARKTGVLGELRQHGVPPRMLLVPVLVVACLMLAVCGVLEWGVYRFSWQSTHQSLWQLVLVPIRVLAHAAFLGAFITWLQAVSLHVGLQILALVVHWVGPVTWLAGVGFNISTHIGLSGRVAEPFARLTSIIGPAFSMMIVPFGLPLFVGVAAFGLLWLVWRDSERLVDQPTDR